MNKASLRAFFLQWILPILALLAVNMAFLSPAYFKGDILDQDDIKLGYAKTKEIRDYREKTGEEPLWTNAMFSGMPTTQITTNYGGNIFDVIFEAVRLVGGRTSSTYIIFYLMLAAFIGLRGLDVRPWLSAIGGFAYGYSGFFIIGYAAGHNAKVNTAAFIPLMVLGMLLLFHKRNWKSFALMALFLGLSIHRNHFQITYYSGLLLAIIWVVYAVSYFRNGEAAALAKNTGLLLVAGLLAIGPNLANIWATKVYSEESMRGGNSELSVKNTNQGEGGLSFDYAMSWSAGLYETVALVIPDAAGGGMMVDYSKKNTETFDNLKTTFMRQRMSPQQAEEQANTFTGYAMHWAGESMGNGAYYVGASVFFLFVLAFFTVGGTTRQWVIAATTLFLLMGWGMNLRWFNELLFNYLPLYKKFRVPSMAWTTLFFIVPFYGLYGLDSWMKLDAAQRMNALKKAAYTFAGFLVLFGLIVPYLITPEGAKDAALVEQGFDPELLIGDRRALVLSSTLRTFFFGGLIASILYIYHLGKFKSTALAFALLGGVVLGDLLIFDRDQLEWSDFQSKRRWEMQYAPNAANLQILKDKDPHFRVYNTTADLTSDSYTSYHHKSIGGYHGAKLQRYQDLIDRQLKAGNAECFNMLNTKWFIGQTKDGQIFAQPNTRACGNAWSVDQVQWANNADEEMNALSSFDPHTTAVVDVRFKDYLESNDRWGQAQVSLTGYDPKYMEYDFQGERSLVVFSEIYYEGSGSDWQAYIDGTPVDHIRVNYLLRGLVVPAGKHTIAFEFAPKTFYTGRKVNFAASGVLLAVLLLMGFLSWRSRKDSAPKVSESH